MRKLPTGTVTFLFSDIEGSTRLLAELGERYEVVLEQHRDVMRNAFARHGGVEVDTQGDAFFCAFASAREALAAAEEAQRGLAEGAVRVRIGLHTGEPKLGREGYVGMDVHRAARICSAGHGGQILLSQPTRDLLEADLVVRDLGEHRLKDLTAPERLYQLVAPGLEDEFPALKTLDARPTNLPTQPTPLVGRERELEELQGLLAREDVRLLTLVGPGGTGKTRVALQLVAESTDQFPDGAFVAFLAPIADPALVVPALGQVLKLRHVPGQDLSETLKEYLADREILVLFDNFEHLLEAATGISSLLAAAPGLKLVVTSRAPLRVSGEREYALEPLPASDAAELFAARAQAVRADFDPNAHADAIESICERLDRLPLALELAAARVRSLTPETLLLRLDSALDVLTGGARDAEERQRTLRGTIEWSYRLLSESEQAVLRRLSVFRGGWTLEAAEAVCDPSAELDSPVLDVLDALVENSLVRTGREVAGELRSFTLETIREFASERLEAAGEAPDVRRRHAECITEIVERGATEFAGLVSVEWLERLDAERGNVLAALAWLSSEEDDELFARLVAAVSHWWDVRGYVDEGRGWLEEARSRPGLSTRVRSRVLYGVFAIARDQGDNEHARAAAAEEVALFRDQGDQVLLARAVGRLGLAYAGLGEPETAVSLLEESVELARASGDLLSLSASLVNLGDVALGEGEFERARDFCGQALELFRETGDIHGVCVALYDTGMCHLHEGRLDEAEPLFVEVLEIAVGRGWQEGILYPFEALARVAEARGEAERAARLLGAAQTIQKQLGNDDARVAETAADLRAFLGEPAFLAAVEAGGALDKQDAVAFALRSSPATRW